MSQDLRKHQTLTLILLYGFSMVYLISCCQSYCVLQYFQVYFFVNVFFLLFSFLYWGFEEDACHTVTMHVNP